ncbi:MAG: HD domain-containing protein [Parachlamydiaceae bacterium]
MPIPALKDLNLVAQDPRWHPEGDVWTHTLLVIDNLPSNATFAMALCALFHDVGKATVTVIHETGRITAHGHEKDSKKITAEILVDLGADAKLKEDVLFLVFRHMIAHSKDANIKTLHRLIIEVGTELVDQLLLHGVADVKGGCGDFTDCIRLREIFDSMDKQPYKSG